MTLAQGSAGRPATPARRAGRLTNVSLLVLLVGAFATGGVAYATGTAGAAQLVTAAHGAFGLSLLLLVPWKSVIVRRGFNRGGRRLHPSAGAGLGLVLLLAVVAGVVHSVTGFHLVLGYTALTVHVAAAVLALPLLVAHARGRRQRLRQGDVSRRTVLRAGALGLGSLATYGTLEATTALLGLPGGQRRGTGSYELGSGAPDRMPVTQWFTDSVPAVAQPPWQLSVGTRSVSYAELAAGTDVMRAVLDCTGGWYAEQEWQGVRVDRLVGPIPAGVRSLVVISETGYSRLFPIADLDRLLLATTVAGRPLSAGHGAPARLVAPGRRGFWWVKWVRRIELTARPWWAQPPFPLH